MITDSEFATLKGLVDGAVTAKPAHAQTLRNRMLDAVRGTPLHRLVLRSTDAEIAVACAQLELPMVMVRVRVGGYGRPVPAWSTGPAPKIGMAPASPGGDTSTPRQPTEETA